MIAVAAMTVKVRREVSVRTSVMQHLLSWLLGWTQTLLPTTRRKAIKQMPAINASRVSHVNAAAATVMAVNVASAAMQRPAVKTATLKQAIAPR